MDALRLKYLHAQEYSDSFAIRIIFELENFRRYGAQIIIPKGATLKDMFRIFTSASFWFDQKFPLPADHADDLPAETLTLLEYV